MVLTGALVNGIAIVAGSLLGRLLHRIPENIKETVMKAMGLAVAVLGIQMGLKSDNFLLVIASLVVGAVIGELLALENKLASLGGWLERTVKASEQGSVSQGFITASLVFVVGAMGILGALDSGIRGNHDVLFTKAVMDGVMACILTTTLGIGVMFSAVPVFLYEGLIALFATQINRFVPETLMNHFITEMTSAGGIMILAIGTNILGLTKIKVANLVPAIVVVAVIVGFV